MENKDNGQAPQPQEEVEEKVETQEKHEKKDKKHHHHHHHHQPQPEKIHVSFTYFNPVTAAAIATGLLPWYIQLHLRDFKKEAQFRFMATAPLHYIDIVNNDGRVVCFGFERWNRKRKESGCDIVSRGSHLYFSFISRAIV